MTLASVRLVTKLREEGKRQGKRGRDPRIIRCLLRHRLLISVSVLCNVAATLVPGWLSDH